MRLLLSLSIVLVAVLSNDANGTLCGNAKHVSIKETYDKSQAVVCGVLYDQRRHTNHTTFPVKVSSVWKGLSPWSFTIELWSDFGTAWETGDKLLVYVSEFKHPVRYIRAVPLAFAMVDLVVLPHPTVSGDECQIAKPSPEDIVGLLKTVDVSDFSEVLGDIGLVDDQYAMEVAELIGEHIRSYTDDQQFLAIHTLRLLGKRAAPALPDLQWLAKHERGGSREAAQSVIKIIEGYQKQSN